GAGLVRVGIEQHERTGPGQFGVKVAKYRVTCRYTDARNVVELKVRRLRAACKVGEVMQKAHTLNERLGLQRPLAQDLAAAFGPRLFVEPADIGGDAACITHPWTGDEVATRNVSLVAEPDRDRGAGVSARHGPAGDAHLGHSRRAGRRANM